jgi:RNA polymerase sigma factor (sigma-70 family)
MPGGKTRSASKGACACEAEPRGRRRLPSLTPPAMTRRCGARRVYARGLLWPRRGLGARLDVITTTTLLDGLRDTGNARAWRRFEERFHPMVLSFARKLGLNETDAQDAAQETMMNFVEVYREGRYDRSKGRLRNWLFGIARRTVVDILRRRPKEVAISDATDATAFIETVEGPDPAARIWEHEWRCAVLQACVSEVAHDVQPETLAAFDLYVLRQWPVERVAEQLGITTNAVYLAKNHVMTRIRQIREQIEAEF